MIISLQKGYITHPKRLKQSHQPLQDGVRTVGIERRAITAPAQKKELNKIKSEPAEINFCGFSNAPLTEIEGVELSNQSINLAIEDWFKDFVNSAKGFVKPSSSDKKEELKALKEFIGQAVAHANEGSEPEAAELKEFLNNETNFANAKKSAEYSEWVLNFDKDEEKLLKGDGLKKAINELAKGAAELVKTTENAGKIYTSKVIKNLLSKAANNQMMFSALFALGLTCFLRPATIMATPGQKKNLDDKKFASAHSIASGVIGYVMSIAVSKPISDGIKRISEAPKEYFKKTDKDGKLVAYYLSESLESKKFKRSKMFDKARTIINMGHETVIAPFKAIITIALIPPILKYVFGLEKKPHSKTEPTSITQNYAAINFKSNQHPKAFQSFMGGTK